MQPGQRSGISVSSAAPICFSTGEPFRTSSGLNISTQGGGAPFAQMSIDADNITISTSVGGSAADFSVRLFLAASQKIVDFYLSAQSDNGINISAVLPMQEVIQINANKTIFSWWPH